MAVTKEQRRAALIALSLLASAGGGYVAKDDLIAIGQRYCGPVPTAVLELTEPAKTELKRLGIEMPTLEATEDNLKLINANPTVAKHTIIKLNLGEAHGMLAAWCDPDRQRLDDTVAVTLTKGER